MKGKNIFLLKFNHHYLNNIFLKLLMLLLKRGVSQVYEVILLLANLNYLVIWRDNLKLSLGLGGRLLKIPVINVLTLGSISVGLLSLYT